MPRRADPPAPPAQALDARLVKVISHPLRQRIMVELGEAVASPNELATTFGEPLGRVSYHVRTLAAAGAIELVRTEPRRGAVEHFYRARVRPWFSDADWARLPRSVRRTIHGQNLQRVWEEAAASAQGDGFDHPAASVGYAWLELDDEGMAALAEEVSRLLERAFAIEAESAERSSAGATARSAGVALLLFERAPGERS